MSYVLPILFVLGVYVALPAVLVAGWVRWARRRQIGRTWPSLTGFSLGTASAALAIGAMVYARAVGGFPFYDPSLLRIYRWGLLRSLAGLVFGVVGLRWSGPVRWAGGPLKLLLLEWGSRGYDEPCLGDERAISNPVRATSLPSAAFIAGRRWALLRRSSPSRLRWSG
jgi:hypothetical protein